MKLRVQTSTAHGGNSQGAPQQADSRNQDPRTTDPAFPRAICNTTAPFSEDGNRLPLFIFQILQGECVHLVPQTLMFKRFQH